MIYAQFYQDSTGYVPGTIPPQFDKAQVKPIERLGSDGVLVLDRRLSLANQHKAARARAVQVDAIGYRLVHSSRGFSDITKQSDYISISQGV